MNAEYISIHRPERLNKLASIYNMKNSIKSKVKGLIYLFYKKAVRIVADEEWSRMKKQFKYIGDNSFVSSPRYFKNIESISIGHNFSALHNTRIETFGEYNGDNFTPEIIIGNDVSFNSDCHIGCINKIYIGNNVLIASRVYISDHSHGEVNGEAIHLPPKSRPLFSKGPVIIENNVWIGEGACILSGVTIGKNSIVGANAVVTKDVPPNTVVAGAPAKIIKEIA